MYHYVTVIISLSWWLCMATQQYWELVRAKAPLWGHHIRIYVVAHNSSAFPWWMIYVACTSLCELWHTWLACTCECVSYCKSLSQKLHTGGWICLQILQYNPLHAPFFILPCYHWKLQIRCILCIHQCI